MKYYHGTSYESGMNILKTHKFNNINPIWDCSVCGVTYVVSEEFEDSADAAIQLAIEAGQIAAAHKNSQSSKIIVFEFDTESDEFEDDISCENMHECYQIDNDTLNNLIQTGDIKVRVLVFDNAYEPFVRPFYLTAISKKYYTFEDDSLERVCRNISTGEINWFYEDYLHCYEQPSEMDWSSGKE